MTTANNKLAQAIKDRVAEIDVERDRLVALLNMYTNGSAPASEKPARASTARKGREGTFQRQTGGPTDRLMATVRRHPGLAYGELLDAAVEGIETEADNPKRSLGSTLGSLVRRGKIRRSEDKKYYPAEESA